MIMKKPVPLFNLGLITTYQCNLNCKYCYISTKKNLNMSLETAKNILTPVLEESGDVLQVTLMGAETLVAFDMIRDLVEWAEMNSQKRKCLFYGSTNGTLLTPEQKKWFYEHRNSITLGLSYDGIPDIQENNRGTSMYEIDLNFFLKTWPNQKIQMTINEHSVSKMAKGVIYLLEKGFDVNANVAYEKKEWSRKSLCEYYKQLCILAEYYLKHPNAKKIYQFIHPLDLYAKNIHTPPKQKQMCGAGDGFWVFDVDGKYYPCHMLSPLVLKEKELDRLSDLKFEKISDFSDPRCNGCPFISICSTCIGCNFLYRGDLRRRDFTHCCVMEAEVRATIRLELLTLKGKEHLTPDDAKVIKSINELQAFFKKHNRH